VLLAEQLVHQRSVHPGPLVLGAAPVKFPTPATDRDRQCCYRFPQEREQGISACFYMSPCSSDYIFTCTSSAGAWHIVSEGSRHCRAFPADCPHRMHCHCFCIMSQKRVASDTRSFQHIAKFKDSKVYCLTHDLLLFPAAQTISSSCFQELAYDWRVKFVTRSDSHVNLGIKCLSRYRNQNIHATNGLGYSFWSSLGITLLRVRKLKEGFTDIASGHLRITS